MRQKFEDTANLLVGTHRRAAPDTLTDDVDGLRHGTFGVPAASWPLVDASRSSCDRVSLWYGWPTSPSPSNRRPRRRPCRA